MDDPEAREVHLSRKDCQVLQACCRSPVTLPRDLKRARIVLLTADGRSTGSIAEEVGIQPRIVSLWRHRDADHGLEVSIDVGLGPPIGIQRVSGTSFRSLKQLQGHIDAYVNAYNDKAEPFV
ncbi:helix-turn-helix domain-containing protein [Bradyrhizobium sp. LB14.3]|uniref:helix-turn-helix domain-containing protein n=1 Tax=Bradyrhizobium sp. LB14.3 TaxID=3156328 RepID=UPI003398A5E3